MRDKLIQYGMTASMNRKQVALLPECLDDYVDAENPVRVVDVFVDGFDLASLGFERAALALTGRYIIVQLRSSFTSMGI